jgi:hypothetical protein
VSPGRNAGNSFAVANAASATFIKSISFYF